VADSPQAPKNGYGNIYTPHAGSMIINVQRENGLANRTIVLSQRRIRVLRMFLSRKRALLIGAGLVASWSYFAVQAARVPVLTRRVAAMERDARRIDTLQQALAQLQSRYAQVHRMLATDPATAATGDGLTTPARPNGEGR
jgi:hypothetical protein